MMCQAQKVQMGYLALQSRISICKKMRFSKSFNFRLTESVSASQSHGKGSTSIVKC